MAKLSSIKVNLKFPIGEIEGIWEPDDTERKAAWEMYVELVTRISLAELKPGEGLLREALSSLYTLFETTREILRNYGPCVAKPKDKDNLSFGHIATFILNRVLRPVLSKWHPLLLDYENTRESSRSTLEHEKKWSSYEELRQTLNEVRIVLAQYAGLLAQAAKVPQLTGEEESHTADPNPQQNSMLQRYILSQIPVYFVATFLFIYMSSLPTTDIVSTFPFTNWEMPVFPPQVYFVLGLLAAGWMVFLCAMAGFKQPPARLIRFHAQADLPYLIISLVVFIYALAQTIETIMNGLLNEFWLHFFIILGFAIFLYLVVQFLRVAWQKKRRNGTTGKK